MNLFCKKCSKPLAGKQTSYCSFRCSRRHLKSLWQKRRRNKVNESKTKWRHVTNRRSDNLWMENNPHKVIAHKMVKYAIKMGVLVRKPCEKCGNPKSQGHHEDYTKVLDVIWLCSKHHTEIHKQL